MYLLDCVDEEDSEKHPKMFDKYKAMLKIYATLTWYLYLYVQTQLWLLKLGGVLQGQFWLAVGNVKYYNNNVLLFQPT